MRIQVNKSSFDSHKSSKEIGDEIKQLFKANPDGNPFQILYDRNKFDATNAIHERQQTINKLQQ